MVSQTSSESPKMDVVLWTVVVTIITAAIGGNYYFAHSSLLLRVVALLISGSVAVFVASKTILGQKLWALWLEAVQEVRRMHWPTRQETTYTTLAVLAMVFVMGILLWIADSLLLRAVKLLMTGHWGV